MSSCLPSSPLRVVLLLLLRCGYCQSIGLESNHRRRFPVVATPVTHHHPMAPGSHISATSASSASTWSSQEVCEFTPSDVWPHSSVSRHRLIIRHIIATSLPPRLHSPCNHPHGIHPIQTLNPNPCGLSPPWTKPLVHGPYPASLIFHELGPLWTSTPP